jgi:hypothetical protein
MKPLKKKQLMLDKLAVAQISCSSCLSPAGKLSNGRTSQPQIRDLVSTIPITPFLHHRYGHCDAIEEANMPLGLRPLNMQCGAQDVQN